MVWPFDKGKSVSRTPGEPALGPRERAEAVALAAEGLSPAEIAEIFGVSHMTIRRAIALKDARGGAVRAPLDLETLGRAIAYLKDEGREVVDARQHQAELEQIAELKAEKKDLNEKVAELEKKNTRLDQKVWQLEHAGADRLTGLLDTQFGAGLGARVGDIATELLRANPGLADKLVGAQGALPGASKSPLGSGGEDEITRTAREALEGRSPEERAAWLSGQAFAAEFVRQACEIEDVRLYAAVKEWAAGSGIPFAAWMAAQGETWLLETLAELRKIRGGTA